MITGVDIFCGVGGLTHGLCSGGIHVAAGIDVDPECRFPYEANNSAQFVESDIGAVTGKDLRTLWAKQAYRLLAGCAPCQPFSTYGRKKGKMAESKKKWSLVTEFGRLISESEPDFITMENVPQLILHEVFEKFVSSLERRGYCVHSQIVDCVRYGIPQTRKRLVLLASRLGPITLVEPPDLSDGETTVRKAINSLKILRAGEKDPDDLMHSACRLSEINLKRIRASRPGGTWRDWDSVLLADCHRRDSGETYSGVYGRMSWEEPSPTITTQSFGYGNGRFGHPEQDRAITLREAAILQTFPSSYRFLREHEKFRYSVLGRLIGNAVPVKLGEHIASSFFLHLKKYTLANRRRRNWAASRLGLQEGC